MRCPVDRVVMEARAGYFKCIRCGQVVTAKTKAGKCLGNAVTVPVVSAVVSAVVA